MAKVIGTPRLKGPVSFNCCAFCQYWDGDPQLERYKISDVLYNGDGRGSCLAQGSEYRGSSPACPRFEMSYEARRYCKL